LSDGLNIPLNIQSKEAFNKLEKDAKTSGSKAGSGLSSGIGNALSVGAGVLGAALLAGAFRKLTGAVSDSINAANRQEDAINSLNIALKASGRFTEEASKDFQDYASSLQKASTFGDELILENAAIIQSLGQLDQQGLKRATKAAIDLSAALNIDLRSAATLVGKAAAGEVGSFSRYGVAIKKGKDNAETFARTLDLLEGKFGGAAAGKVDTTRGAYDQFSNSVGDLAEAFGRLITKNSFVLKAIKLSTEGIENFTKAIDPSSIEATANQIDFLRKKLETLRGAGAAGSESFKLAQLQLEQQKKILQTQIIDNKAAKDRIATDDANAARTAAANALIISEEDRQKRLDAIKAIGLSQSQLLDAQYQENLTKLEIAQEADINQSINFNERKLELERQYQEARAALDISTPLEEQALNFENFTTNLTASLENLAKTSKVTGADVAKSMQQGIGGGAAKGFAAFGAAIAKGENGLGAFSKALFQSIGENAVALGTSFLLSGAAMLFSPDPKDNAKAPFLITAGASLAAFGGAIGALSGGGGGAGGAGGSASSGGVQQEPREIAQEERQDPQTAVTVNIQGDVLDSEESSLRIAELLQKAVSDQGVRFV
jgi:hypothetical protein